jgi:hypothetical protein
MLPNRTALAGSNEQAVTPIAAALLALGIAPAAATASDGVESDPVIASEPRGANP